MRDWECCVKRVQANERDKRGCGCSECAGGVSVSEATSKTTFPPSGLYATDGDQIPARETNCDIVIAGSVKLRTWKKASPWTGCSSSPLPVLTYASSAVRVGVGDITQNKGVLKRGMSEPRLALRLPLKPGQMPL